MSLSLSVVRVVRALAIAVLTLLSGAGCSNSESQFLSFPDAQVSNPGTNTGDATLTLFGGGGYSGPTTCDQAAMTRSYIGCDYWPTVTTNPVWSIFDFTVVVANAQSVAASVTVTGPYNTNQMLEVAPGALAKVYLPWVPALKGPDCDECGSVPIISESITALASAYHVVSSVPVTVYQFNALEYKGAGGPTGKDWSQCPGTTKLCTELEDAGVPAFYSGCYSYTNDASLLIPSTAMTGNYRVAGQHAQEMIEGSYFAITAISDSTTVTVTLSATGSVVGGGTVQATPAGGVLNLVMNSGDVIEVMSDMLSSSSDLSGSLVHASQPVQVIAGVQCSEEPAGYAACDHLESSMLPAETLGSDYVVSPPTSPGGAVVGHVVRFYGNVDGTTLTYSPAQPAGCPSALDAGQVATCGSVVNASFEVTGNHEFAVMSFQLGGDLLNMLTGSNSPDGDPSMSPMVATEEYLQSYIFLAPTDYDSSYMDVVGPPGAQLRLDNELVTTTSTPINGSWSITRVPLVKGGGGTHVLSATAAVGVQVMGYGAYTSYQYPAGLDLTEISAPPLK